MPCFRSPLLLLFAVLAILGEQPFARAAIVTAGNVEPSDPATWTTSTLARIANSSDATLTVDLGTDITSGTTTIGVSSKVTGRVLINGAGTTWKTGNLLVGSYGNGALDITAGGAVTSYWGAIGLNFPKGSISTSVVTVDGTGSTWTTQDLDVGHDGIGTLAISGGGAVNSFSNAWVGVGAVSTGTVGVNGAGSTWNHNGSLYVGGSGHGTLNVASGGAVVSLDSAYIGYASTAVGLVTVNGASSTLTNRRDFYVGYDGSALLTIAAGGAVNSETSSYKSYIGANSGSTGTAIVDGVGSKWTNYGLYIGNSGNGTLDIVAGGSVVDAAGYIGYNSTGTGLVTVRGAGSKWTNNALLSVGSSGRGTLVITDGGTVNTLSSSASSNVGSASSAVGLVTVDGTGSTWTNAGDLIVGGSGRGTVNISGGGAATTKSFTIVNSQSLLAIDVGNGSSLTVTNNMLANIGKVRILAGAGAPTGTYSPITASNWSGPGVCQPVGGKWNTSSHVFTASDVQAGAAGSQLTLDLFDKQRVKITDGADGWALGASFLAAASPTTLGFTATPIGGATRESLEGLLEPGKAVLGGWQFTTTSGYTAGDPAYLSFDVGAGFSRSDFSAWQYAAGAWTPFDASDLTYDGQYASFTVTDLSPYAISAVPEPASILLLGSGGLLGLFGWWRRVTNQQQQFGLLGTRYDSKRRL